MVHRGFEPHHSHHNNLNTMTKYFNTITQISVGQEKDNPVYGECIRIKLEDECGGMFLVFEQDAEDGKPHQVRIDIDEWENIQDAVHMLLNQKLVK